MPRCPNCQEIIPAGSNCLVGDSDCFEITGSGESPDDYGSPFIIEAILSADVDQRLTCTLDGLFADIPAVLREPPSAQAYSTVNLTIANNAMTTLALNSEKYDTDTMHDNAVSNSRVTFTTAGVYLVTLNALWYKNATGDRIALIRKNGTDILVQDTQRAGGDDLRVGHSLTLVDNFSATDYVEGRVQQTSGANLVILSRSDSPFLSATRVA